MAAGCIKHMWVSQVGWICLMQPSGKQPAEFTWGNRWVQGKIGGKDCAWTNVLSVSLKVWFKKQTALFLFEEDLSSTSRICITCIKYFKYSGLCQSFNGSPSGYMTKTSNKIFTVRCRSSADQKYRSQIKIYVLDCPSQLVSTFLIFAVLSFQTLKTVLQFPQMAACAVACKSHVCSLSVCVLDQRGPKETVTAAFCSRQPNRKTC